MVNIPKAQMVNKRATNTFILLALTIPNPLTPLKIKIIKNPTPACINPPYIPIKKNKKIDKFFFFIFDYIPFLFLFFFKKILIITKNIITDNIFLKNSSGNSIAIFAPISEPIIEDPANQTENL